MQNPLFEKDIEQVLRLKTETKNLDYKQGLNWVSCSNDDKAGIVKDILAMANTQDGGRIIFGVHDNDFEPIGLSDEESASFDQTKVNDFLHRYTDPKFTCYVYKHTLDAKRFVVIDVPEFPEVPIICKQDANSSKDGKLILGKGQLYIRTEKATSELLPSAQEMRELMGRAITKRGDELLGNIERLLKGRPPKATEESAEKYQAEIRDAGSLDIALGQELTNLGSWALTVYPAEYNPKRISDHQRIKELIQKSEVQLRGWNFPHTDTKGNVSNFTRGRQSYTVGDRHTEGYRAYQSGLFVWKSPFWEDKQGHSENGRPVLSFVNVIWSLTEFMIFLRRYYEQISPDGSIHLQIVMNGTKNRELVALGGEALPIYGFVAQENPIFIQEDIQVVELKAAYKEIATNIIKQIFAIFNWEDADPVMIENWQTKLIERKF